MPATRSKRTHKQVGPLEPAKRMNGPKKGKLKISKGAEKARGEVLKEEINRDTGSLYKIRPSRDELEARRKAEVEANTKVEEVAKELDKLL